MAVSVMWSFSIVPDKPIKKFVIETIHVHEKRSMVIDKLFLNRPIEPFAVSIHFRGLGIRVPMRET